MLKIFKLEKIMEIYVPCLLYYSLIPQYFPTTQEKKKKTLWKHPPTLVDFHLGECHCKKAIPTSHAKLPFIFFTLSLCQNSAVVSWFCFWKTTLLLQRLLQWQPNKCNIITLHLMIAEWNSNNNDYHIQTIGL